jgi:hypothetical protein
MNLRQRNVINGFEAEFRSVLIDRNPTVLFASERGNAQQSTSVAISVKDHHFQPSQISAPANRPISIRVKNLDSAPMEFESTSLRVEKVIAAGSEGVVNVRALAPGHYEFFDDFHQQTRGTLIVQ